MREGLALDHLPPTVTDQDLLALLGTVLAGEVAAQSTAELRLRFFRPGFSWQALVDLGVAHDVLPPLVFSLKRRSLLPPVPAGLGEDAQASHVTSRLDAAYGQHMERQADLRRQLLAALAVLNAESIVPLLLKGAMHLTMGKGEWHEARGMRDLDLLVRAADAQRAHRLLSSQGYQADSDPPPLDRHLPELWRPGYAGTIEIHTEALSFNARRALTTEEVWARAETRHCGDAVFKVLPAEWHALHGLLHHQLADRGHARRMLAVKGLWEFSRVTSQVSPEGWRAIIDVSADRRILPVLSSWTIQANRLFGLDAPQELVTLQAGRKHADATFRRARQPHAVRQALFLADKLSFAFAPETLALRYGPGHSTGAALRHLAFLWRRRGQAAGRWLGH